MGMGQGYLKVDVHTANALPISGAKVIIADTSGQVLYSLTTDENGQTQYVPLSAPEKALSLSPGGEGYSTYAVTVAKDGYIAESILGAEVFDTIFSTQTVMLHPNFTGSDALETLVVPDSALKQTPPGAVRNPRSRRPSTRTLADVTIPARITVHMGAPGNINAKNITVRFQDYIKNVTASEIYATWPEASIKANIHAIVSLALNRIYTEWYRLRGYPFDITNSTQYDQYYKEGQTIPDNISQAVDEYFNQYIHRIGYKEPLFSSFCNGTTATCPGMSQWGSVSLANAGYSPMDILHYYYGDNIELAETERVSSVLTSYPGYTLSQGSSGPPVKQMQEYLNRIATNFPAIAKMTPDGQFGPTTAASVRAFQKSQNMAQTGVIDKATWNKISFIYTAVTKLAELTSEGERIGIGRVPPASIIGQGARGKDVVEIQFLLDAIGTYYDTIPPLIKDAYFGPTTVNAVRAFQRQFGLRADGIVGPQTWRKLYEVYRGLGIGGGTGIPAYPGAPLSVGTRGENVDLIQSLLNALSDKYPSIPKITRDGIYGPKTAAQVAAFQRIFGLEDDGIVGRLTWGAVMDAYFNDGKPR